MILYSFKDVDGDRLAVFDAAIPIEGKIVPGVNIRTDPDGCSIPLDQIGNLIVALEKVWQEWLKTGESDGD